MEFEWDEGETEEALDELIEQVEEDEGTEVPYDPTPEPEVVADTTPDEVTEPQYDPTPEPEVVYAPEPEPGRLEQIFTRYEDKGTLEANASTHSKAETSITLVPR